MIEELNLSIELVPQTIWYSNLRDKTLKEKWDKIRKKSYANSGYKCVICKAEED